MIRDTYEMARLELAAAAELVEQQSEIGELQARLYGFTRVLYDNAITRAAWDAVVEERPVSADGVKSFLLSASLETRCKGFQELRARIQKLVTSALESGLPDESASLIRDAWAQRYQWGVDALPFEGLLSRLSDPAEHEDLPDDKHSQMLKLKDTADRITDALAGHDFLGDGPAQLRAFSDTFFGSLQTAFSQFGSLKPVVEAMSFHELNRRLFDFHSAMTDLMALRLSLPLERGHAALENDRKWIHSTVKRVTSVVTSRLSTGPLLSLVLDRLVQHLERFSKLSVVERLRAWQGRPEDALQEIVDRFVFSDGLYPITHCKAGQGNIDTFLEDDVLPLLERGGARPSVTLLLELKQLLTKDCGGSNERTDVTDTILRNTITSALAQAEEYRKGMAAKAGWQDAEVHVVVVYSGKSRYAVATNNVRLAYLGPTPPSKSKLLNLE